jgi:hypothetical protein
MSQTTQSATAPLPRGPWLSLGVVAVALFLSVLSMSIVAVALPAIGHALGATPTDLQWLPRGSGVGVLDPAQAAAFVAGLHHALWLAGLVLLAATALAVVMLRRA